MSDAILGEVLSHNFVALFESMQYPAIHKKIAHLYYRPKHLPAPLNITSACACIATLTIMIPRTSIIPTYSYTHTMLVIFNLSRPYPTVPPCAGADNSDAALITYAVFRGS